MIEGLRIGSLGERLPLEAAAARHVALSKSGFGKSNFTAVMAEELHAADVPVAVMDPLGKMSGLRSSADGEREGLPIAVLGGRQGDVDLRSDRGAYVADLYLDGASMVLDFSAMLDDDYCGFVADFLTRVSQKADRVLHIIFEESERFMPERARKGEHYRLKSVMGRFARECRNFGVGFTASTQRPQLMDKNVIDSAEIIYAMKLTGDLAQEAIGAEASSRCGRDVARKILADVPNLEKGGAWLIPDDESSWGVPRRIRFRLRETFEIRPPKIGEGVRAPRVLAAVDLEQLRSAMQADVAKTDAGGDAAASDPELQARIDELQRDLVTTRSQRDHLASLIESINSAMSLIESTSRAVIDGLSKEAAAMNARSAPPETALAHSPAPVSTIANSSARAQTAPISKGAMGLVETLVARSPARLTRRQLATLAGRSIKSSTFWPHVTEAIDAGLIERSSDGRLAATTKAVQAFPNIAPATPTDVRARWLNAMPTPGARRMLEVLYAVSKPLTREAWAERAGVSVTSSALGQHIAVIVDNGLAERSYDGTFVLSDFLRN